MSTKIEQATGNYSDSPLAFEDILESLQDFSPFLHSGIRKQHCPVSLFRKA